MRSNPASSLLALTFLLAGPTVLAAQQRRSSQGPPPAATEGGVPRDSRFPYAGLWAGVRTMPMGADSIRLSFTVAEGKYNGRTHVGGGAERHENLVMSAAGISWTQRNSGGGTWVYRVRLAGPDSLAGTLELTDGPPDLDEVAKGSVVLVRQPPAPPGTPKRQ